MTKPGYLPSLALLLMLWLPGASGQTPNAPPPAVTVTEVRAGDVPLSYEHAARVAASREVQVRAQAGGILLAREFIEGAEVKAGDILFRIDPAPYRAELALAQAQLQQAQAQLDQAKRDADRAIQLARSGAGSERARDEAVAQRDLAEAGVAAARARVTVAELNLGYTTVHAPISGITSQEQVPEGSLIGTGDASLLTRITQLDPVHVYFSTTQSELEEARALLESQGLWGRAGELVKVRIMFGDGRIYEHAGTIDFAASGLDPQTGTLRVRATVPNPERRLLPGQFVRAIVTGITLKDAIVIPHAALLQGPQGQFVYTVNREGRAEARPVQLGREVDTGWIVESGLTPGDRLITEGIIKVRPGAPVSTSGATAAESAR